MTIGIIASIIFILGYIGITLEHKTHINKSAFALITGTLLWVLVGLTNPHAIDEHIIEAGFDIFSITIFLLGAMSLVEILIHYRLFDIIRDKLLSFNVSIKKQFIILSILAFFLSGIIDNLTTTIVLIQIARKFFWKENLLVAAVSIVIAANAGGAFSPIGDVTTIMLWIAGKFSASEIILKGFLPVVVLATISTFLLSFKIKKEDTISEEIKVSEPMTSGEKVVITAALFSFLLPILAKTVHLPPVMGILLGVGVTWFIVDLLKGVSTCRTHLTASIENLVQKTDISSIKFFIGILLAVSALSALGILEYVSHVIYGETGEVMRIISGNIIIGLISSILDNIPLTAIAIDILETTDTDLWILLALSVGTGGSLLPIGSASGVIAMGLIKDLTFKEYIRIGFIPAFVAFCFAVLVWAAQTFLF